MDIENLGVNEPEVAEPVTEGVNESEVAEQTEGQGTPPDDGHSASEAWARIRRESADNARRAEEAERQLAELQARENARASTISRLTGRENGDIEILAESMDLDPSDLAALISAEQDNAEKDNEIQRLRGEVASAKAESQMKEDLAEIQKIDPSITSCEQLGESYVSYIKAGLSATDAYFAVKSKEAATTPFAPKEIGKVNSEPPEKDFFTKEEVDAMTSEQRYKNADKILASFSKWKRK